MPVTRSEKRRRVSSEQTELPSNNLAQISKLELAKFTSPPKKNSKNLPSGSDVSPSNDNTVTPGPKSDPSFAAPQEEPRIRRLRSRSYVTSSNKTDIAYSPELELGKSLSRSEKRSEQRLLKKLQSRSDVPPSNASSVASALKADLSSYTQPELPVKNLRSRSYLSSLGNINTPTPAPKLDMRSYNPQEMGSRKIHLASYVNSASKIDLPDTLEEMCYVPHEEVGEREHRSNLNRSSTKRGNRSPSPASGMRFTSPQENALPLKKKSRLLETATNNDIPPAEFSASDTSSRVKIHFKKPGQGPTLSQGDSVPSPEGISTSLSESLPASTPFTQSPPTQAPEDLSSPLSEHNSASSLEDNPASHCETNVSPLPKSKSSSSTKNTSAPYPGPQSKEKTAPHPDNSAYGISSSPKSNFEIHTPRKEREDSGLTNEMSPEKQTQYRAERDREPQRPSEQQKLLMTMDDFKKGFQDLLNHIRAPRKNSHNRKNPNEHMFALKLSPQLCLMKPSLRHTGIYMKDACFDSTSEAMIIWVMGLLMEVVKNDGLAWGSIAIEMTEAGSLGKVSNWGVNSGCAHRLETCFINTNVEILFCKKTCSAIITYHYQWKCAGQYEVPSGDMTGVVQTPRQSRTGHTTTGGGRSFQMGAGESGYGLGSHTPLAGPQFSQAAAAAFNPRANAHTVAGRHIAPSLADYLPANPYLSPYRSPAHVPPQAASNNPVDFGNVRNSATYPTGLTLSDPALVDPALSTWVFDPTLPPLPLRYILPASEPPQQPSTSPLLPSYQWVMPETPYHHHDYISLCRPLFPSPAQGQFTYPDPGIATEEYVADWVAVTLNRIPEPGRGSAMAGAPFPVLVPVVAPMPAFVLGRRARKSRARVHVAAAPPETPTAATSIPALAPEPAFLGHSPAQTLAALQSAASSSPGVPIPAAYRHVWFLNGRGRVSKTRDNNPRCRRCRRRHWASCSRGQPCDECAKDDVLCVYGPGVGTEEQELKEEKGR
ncbi:hypothetical protein V493_01891 [Pseudogymnoascus sp. VKM F-4281 (FW-2241)]|nr:hypothetical protein V493_01891 [Pseudogymnoascus sp. VKM F-4281 (FW-2241)]